MAPHTSGAEKVSRNQLGNQIRSNSHVVVKKDDQFAFALPDAEVASSGKVGLC